MSAQLEHKQYPETSARLYDLAASVIPPPGAADPYAVAKNTMAFHLKQAAAVARQIGEAAAPPMIEDKTKP